jgi:hypothetical protein
MKARRKIKTVTGKRVCLLRDEHLIERVKAAVTEIGIPRMTTAGVVAKLR